MMTFKLSRRSMGELKGVHPDLVAVTKRALELSSVDFAVHDGLRTDAEQAHYVDTGVSQTLHSMHLKQSDGYGHAVDLVPVVNGKLRWEWAPIYEVAKAVRQAAEELGVRIRWGGCWQVINTTTLDPRELVEAYAAKRRRRGRRAFMDGPHFELKG